MANIQYITKVNINRFKEGARVLEDIARFIFEHDDLFKSIKDIKNQLINFDNTHNIYHINNYSLTDIGNAENYQEVKHAPRNNLLDIINSNAKRMQEAARSLEELNNNYRHFFKQLRFTSYEIYNQLLLQYNIYNNNQKLTGLYLICNPEKHSVELIAKVLNNLDINIIQIRMKNSSKNQIYHATKKLKNLISKNIIIIINDHLDIALSIADGVHLGQDDLPLEAAFNIINNHNTKLNKKFILGITCHNTNEVEQALCFKPDYISIGCIFDSITKLDTVPVSLNQLTELCNLCKYHKIPVSVIGGINQNNFSKLNEYNIDLIAVHSAIWNSDDYFQIIKNANQLVFLRA